MAQHVEPMDIDSSVCDFDDKENAFHHNNAQPRTPCTEKGYEELDVSELNMKLRYSITPATSPMSKSYAGNCYDNKNHETDNTLEGENGNMNRSLHTTLTTNDTIVKTQKTPLQSLPTDLAQISDGNRNVLQPLDSTVSVDNNITVTLSGPNDVDESLSLPSSSSSMTHTPEATTPTKEIPKGDEGSPIMRGLKSVLNMFRPSQSPIPGEEDFAKLETLSPPIVHSPETQDDKNEIVSASTPLVGHKTKDPLTKRQSPKRESIVFNEDLENELEWKDDSTILFSNEKIPIHKLFFQLPKSFDSKKSLDLSKEDNNEHMKDEGQNTDASVEYMDISYNDSGIMDKTATATKILSELNRSEAANTESDSEFVDCETTFTKNDSIKSQTDNELDSTEDVLSHINDLVEPKNVNASLETLHASDAKSINLSTASIETAKQNDSLPTIADTTHEEKIKEEIQAEDTVKESIPAVSDKIIIVPNVELVSDSVTSNSNIQINETVVNSPLLENMGVKSLSQIPLIADPRFLLFNIPPCVNDVKNEEVTNEGLKALPADIPLPEDDDMLSLPGMNSELENLSHALDKIAEEIPKINQHESSVSSVGSLSDNKSNESTLPENIFSTEFAEIVPKANCENLLTQNAIHTETKLENDVKTFEISESKYAYPATDPISENKIILENIALADAIPKDTNVAVIPTETKTIAEDTILPSIGKDVNMPIPAISKIETEDGNPVLPTIVLDNIDMPVFISDQACFEMDEKGVIPDEISVTDSALVPEPEVFHAIPEVEKNVQSEIVIQEVEPMDVNIAGMPVATEFNVTHKCEHENLSSTSEVNTVKNNSADLIENEDLKIESPTLSLEVNAVLEVLRDIPVNTKVIQDKSKAQIIESNIDFIKQEVEAIVAKAIDIATEKSKDCISEGKVNNKLDINDVIASLTDIASQDIEQVSEKIEPENYSLKHLESTKAFNETNVVSSDEEADVQQKSLNQLSANKYSYTVQDNVPVNKTNHIVDPAEALNNETFCLLESPEISSGSSKVVENYTANTNALQEIEIQMQSAPIEHENITLNITPPDMVKIEPITTTDEEIIASANNSPFVSVSHVLEDAVEGKPIRNFDSIENPTDVNSKIIKSPPASPKIVSKGYNFNFDEIDDPFATKTKIRMSPALDAPENQTLEQAPPNKEANKNYRRRSQPDRRRPAVNNKKMNSTFSGKSVCGSEPTTSAVKATQSSKKVKAESPKSVDEDFICQDVTMNATRENGPEIEENKLPAECVSSIDSNAFKGTSSSEQSIYLYAGASSDEAIHANCGIKLPDLDDPAFNPFASKSKIQQSPPPENVRSPFATRSRICQTPPPLSINDPFATKCKIRSSPETSSEISKDDEKPAVPSNCTEMTHNINNNTIEVPVGNKTVNIEPEQAAMLIENNMKLDLPEEKESNENISGTTCSSNNDKESTVREINTEDEDTVEGPFLEADDLQNYDKMSDFDEDNVDMMQFSETPPRNEENPDAGELFIDAEAFEFLLNQNANTVSDSGKESLFLKFDPLFAKRLSSDGVLAALKHGQSQVKQSTPLKIKKQPILRDATFDTSSPLDGSSVPRDATFDNSSPLVVPPPIPRDATFDKSSPLVVPPPIPRDATFDKSSPLVVPPPIPRDANFDKSSPLAGPSSMNTTQEIDLNDTAEDSYEDLNVTVSKPMMVVSPAVNPVVTPRNKTITPVRSNRHSLTFTSPAIAVIDRLLSMSGANNSLMAHETSVAEVPRNNEADLALTQLRELLAEKDISVYNQRSETKELQNRLATLESQMKNLENISENRLKKINDLNEKLNEKAQINKKMAKVVEEYERTIASLIDETEQDRKRHAEERIQLIKERDEQTAHLASMEVSFSDLHSKYEKSKQIIIGFKANEDAYKKSIKDFEENLAKMQKNYELLKQHATSKLNHANEELQKINRAHEAEVLKMNAMIKRKELQITSLEETLQQKTKANEELTAICDELINKVG